MKETVLRFIFAILFLPLVLVVESARSQRSLFPKVGYALLALFLFSFTWTNGYRNLFRATNLALFELGITDTLTSITVSGTSMMPTISDGETISLHNPNKFGIERGDIVSFNNIETGAFNYIKRIIGLEGETISIINGIVIIDGSPLSEGYVYREAPTFGNTFLIDCQEFTIPKGKFAVLGDNRTASVDSRIIGFVDKSDIKGIIKSDSAPIFTNDIPELDLQNRKLDVARFIDNINDERDAQNAGFLLNNNVLENVAIQRAELISKNIKDWKNVKNFNERLLDSEGYDYFLLQEIVTFGGYDANELTDHVFELRPYKHDFLSPNYFDIGIGTSIGKSGICDVPVNVILLAWPTTPNYLQELNTRWQEDVAILQSLISNISILKTNPNIDSAETETLLVELKSLLERVTQLQSITSRGLWTIENENTMIETYFDNYVIVQRNLGNYIRKNEDQINNMSVKTYLSNFKWGNTEFNVLMESARQSWSRGNYTDQLDAAHKAKEVAENNEELAIGYYWEGLAYFDLGNLSSAKQALQEAVNLNQNYAGPYVTLSATAFLEGNYQLGFEYATRCVELDPNYGWCHNNMGLAYEYLGNRTKAIEHLERAVSLDPDSYVFNDNLKRLR